MSQYLPQKTYWLFWLAASLIYFLPGIALNATFLFGSKDALFYTLVLKLYGQAMAHGEFYPRWFSEANGGYGSPVMIFYSPLAYGLSNLLFGWLPDDPMAHGRFVLGMIAAQIVGGYMAFLWLRPRFGDTYALLGSLLYILFPYKLIYIWFHHNLAQLWALAWLPLWMLAAERMIKRQPYGICLYALAFALVIYTHLLTVLAFAAIPALYVFLLSEANWRRRILQLALAHLLGLALAAAYLLPMFLNKKFVWLHIFTDGYYQVLHNLHHLDTVYCLYYLAIAALAGFLLWRVRKQEQPKNAVRPFWFFSAVTLVWWGMTTPLSEPIWRIITVLQYLQFPMARLHVGLLVSGVWLCLYGYDQWQRSDKKYPVPLIALVIVLASAVLIHHDHRNIVYCRNGNSYSGNDLKVMQARNALALSVYATIWTDPEAEKTQIFTPVKADIIPQWQTNREAVLDINTRFDGQRVVLKQIYFPGWQAVDEDGTLYPVEVNEEDGLMALTLPRGQHHMSLRLPWVLGETSGLFFSGLALFFLIVYRLFQHRLSGRHIL